MRGRAAHQIRRYGRSFALLMGLVLVGGACGFYILLQQRLPNPFQSFYTINVAFPSAAAVVPGLGEPVNVAGVHVGEISGTSLKNGQGIVHMDIDPSKLHRLYRNASAELVPNTPLMDMEVDIQPGTASAGVLPHGATIPVGQTTAPIDSDELLSSLDTDTRSWLTSLITELGAGTSGRGQDIRALLRTLGPTTAQVRQIGDLLDGRRQELSQIVHNLGVLSKATSARDAQLQTVVRAGDESVAALASQNTALQTSIERLPGTLQTARKTLTDVTGLANVLGPTATALLPTARTLPATLRNSRSLFRGAALLPLDKIAPFVKASLPLAAQLPALTADLKVEVPELTNTFKVLAYATNELAYVPGGKNPGFLYWLAWFAHNADSFISNSDANGSAWRTTLVFSCASLKTLPVGSILEALLGTSFGC